MKTFCKANNLHVSLLENLLQLGYNNPTPIQELAIPIAISGQDVLAKSSTGSGKTAAFGIPIIEKLKLDTKEPQALIITPTRELATQVANELRKIARYKDNIKVTILTGGVPMRGQIESLEKGAHIVVGTPGRLQDHLSRDTLPLFEITTLVLDEADKMLDMGFYDAILKITSNIRTKKQTLFFSATYPPKIEKLASSILKNPKVIKIENNQTLDIKQSAIETSTQKKQNDLIHLIKSKRPKSCLVFTNMKIHTEEVCNFLIDNKFMAQSLNGDLDQRDRDEALLMFSNGTVPVLVATDVASRGLDVKEIDLVINYDLPSDRELYTHRIGRTGRAGASGEAITLFTASQKAKLKEISPDIETIQISSLRADSLFVMTSTLNTLYIHGGKKDKLRAGDILGALCKDIGIDSENIGKIDIRERGSYVAISSSVSDTAQRGIGSHKIKNKKFKAWIL